MKTKIQTYEVLFKCNSVVDAPKIEIMMRRAGLTSVGESHSIGESAIEKLQGRYGVLEPLNVQLYSPRMITGLIRAVEISDAEDKAHDIIGNSRGAITGMALKNVTQEQNSTTNRIKRALGIRG